MPNQLNKNKNKIKEKDEIRTAQENLILGQQAECRRRFQQIADGHRDGERAQIEGVHSPSRQRSAEELLEEIQHQLNFVKKQRRSSLTCIR